MLYPNYPMWHTPRLQTKGAIHKPKPRKTANTKNLILT